MTKSSFGSKITVADSEELTRMGYNFIANIFNYSTSDDDPLSVVGAEEIISTKAKLLKDTALRKSRFNTLINLTILAYVIGFLYSGFYLILHFTEYAHLGNHLLLFGAGAIMVASILRWALFASPDEGSTWGKIQLFIWEHVFMFPYFQYVTYGVNKDDYYYKDKPRSPLAELALEHARVEFTNAVTYLYDRYNLGASTGSDAKQVTLGSFEAFVNRDLPLCSERTNRLLHDGIDRNWIYIIAALAGVIATDLNINEWDKFFLLSFNVLASITPLLGLIKYKLEDFYSLYKRVFSTDVILTSWDAIEFMSRAILESESILPNADISFQEVYLFLNEVILDDDSRYMLTGLLNARKEIVHEGAKINQRQEKILREYAGMIIQKLETHAPEMVYY